MCLIVCDVETLIKRGPRPESGCCVVEKKSAKSGYECQNFIFHFISSLIAAYKLKF